MARSVAYRVSGIQGQRNFGSVAARVHEIRAALLRAESGKGNHVGRQLVAGCLPHSKPLLCSVAARGQTLVLQFHPHLWNRIPPDFLPGRNGLVCMFLPRASAQMTANTLQISLHRVLRPYKRFCKHSPYVITEGRLTDHIVTIAILEQTLQDLQRQADRIGG